MVKMDLINPTDVLTNDISVLDTILRSLVLRLQEFHGRGESFDGMEDEVLKSADIALTALLDKADDVVSKDIEAAKSEEENAHLLSHANWKLSCCIVASRDLKALLILHHICTNYKLGLKFLAP
jgi:hypothetical protein